MPYTPYYAPYFPQTNPMPDMLGQYKSSYQPMPQNPPTSDMIWIMGEAGAKAYPVAPGNTVTLWDRDAQVIYIKSADSTGLPSMRVLEWTERSGQNSPEKHVCQCGKEFVKISDFEALREDFLALSKRVEEINKEE